MIKNKRSAMGYSIEDLKQIRKEATKKLLLLEIKKDNFNILEEEIKIKNKNELLKEIKKNHNVFKSINESLKNDKIFVLKALNKNWKIWLEIPNSLKTDLDIISLAISKKQDIFYLLENSIVKHYDLGEFKNFLIIENIKNHNDKILNKIKIKEDINKKVKI